jgi:hypothetical protein
MRKPNRLFPSAKARAVFGNNCKDCLPVLERGKKGGYRCNKYGLTPEQQTELLYQQGKKCCICRKDKKLVLNADNTGKARGYLCRACNEIVKAVENADYMIELERFVISPITGETGGPTGNVI